MKKSILLLSTFLLLVAVKHVSAQWEITGNTINGTEWFGASTTSDIPISFEHRANHANSQFRWFTHNGTVDERMRLTRPGWLGINTTAPDMRFHVLDGGILSSGTTGTNPDMGAGTRMMFIPDMAAFSVQPLVNSKFSEQQELQSLIAHEARCPFNHYFHLPDYRIGHPPQAERSTWNIKMSKPCS
jgi:hypothetical protein